MSVAYECRNCSEIFYEDDEGANFDIGICPECMAALRSISDYW